MNDINNDQTDFETNLPTTSNEKLCEVIVAQRYLGVMEDEALLCMTELAKRRTAGDTFNFEEHITKTINDLPKLKIDMKSILNTPGLSGLLGMFMGGKGKTK